MAESTVNLPTDAKKRKAIPIVTGVLDYFPDAIAAVAELSMIGNEQHNPGEPLHWAKEKSTDEADALARHLLQRNEIDKDGVPHCVKVAWRGLALAQRYFDAQKTKPMETPLVEGQEAPLSKFDSERKGEIFCEICDGKCKINVPYFLGEPKWLKTQS